MERKPTPTATAPAATAAPPTTRERLLDAAARVIARHGYQGARLADVAREAGLTTGAIYSNFRDKQELFVAAFERAQGLTITMLDDPATDLEGIITGYSEAAVQFEASTDIQVLNFELALLAIRNPAVRQHVEEGLRLTVADVAERLRAAGDMEDEATRTGAAALLVGLGNGIALLRMFAPDLAPQALVESAFRALGTGLK